MHNTCIFKSTERSLPTPSARTDFAFVNILGLRYSILLAKISFTTFRMMSTMQEICRLPAISSR